jgi:hypothetical protein
MSRTALLLRTLALTLLLLALGSRAAVASTTQESWFEDDPHMLTDPGGTVARLRQLGVDRVRLAVRWELIAPQPNSRRKPRGFKSANPSDYPAGRWQIWDQIVRLAHQDGIAIDFDVVGGAPAWAIGPRRPAGSRNPDWEPSPGEFGAFVHALAVRYSGNYDPGRKRIVRGDPNDLPAVTFWSIWNEPDYGPSLAPQGLPGDLTVEYAPRMYRNLMDAAWSALHSTGHGGDKFTFGEVAPRGANKWGVFSGMKPLVFLWALYCVDSRYRPLRGSAAALRGCPTTAAGSRRFRRQHPALFSASGFADHPYMRWYPPSHEAQPDPEYSSLGEIGNLERSLDRLERVYGSSKRFPIYDTEFGYITSPPKHRNQYPWVTQATAAYYLNWAEYIHWRDPRMQSFMQYLLYDPEAPNVSNDYGGFASGLLNYRGKPKPTYDAWRLPLYLPKTSTHAGGTLQVWGCVRPARYAILDGDGSQAAQLQFKRGSSGTWTPIASVTVSSAGNCYFDTHVAFPGSGTARLSYTYTSGDPAMPANSTVYSRSVQVSVR